MIEQNSIDKNEIQLKIERIIGKSKETRKLLKEDETDLIELSKAFFQDKQNWNQGLENVLNLPAETGAAVLIIVWELQNDQDQLVLLNEYLKKDKSLISVIKHLYFINELFRKSPEIALEALHTVSISATDFGEKLPNRKILTTCAKTLLGNKCLYKITRGEHQIKKVDFQSTGLLLVSTLLHYWENSTRSGKVLKTVHNLISWLSLNGSRVEFERSITDELEKKAASIDADSQSILLNLGFITKITESNTATPQLAEQPSVVKLEQISETFSVARSEQVSETFSVAKSEQVSETFSVSKSEKVSDTSSVLKQEQISVTTSVEKKEQVSKTPAGIKDEHTSKRTKGEHLLMQLKGYLGGLETTNHELQEAVKTATNEVNSEIYKRKQLEVTTNELKMNLSDKTKEIMILNSQIAHLNAELERMRQELTEKEKEHQEKLQSLVDMTERESVFVKDEFKNKLTSKLRLEYLDFKDILSEEMTVDLGENLRAQLENIFRLLKQEGMNF
jgi:hypothetical protein